MSTIPRSVDLTTLGPWSSNCKAYGDEAFELGRGTDCHSSFRKLCSLKMAHVLEGQLPCWKPPIPETASERLDDIAWTRAEGLSVSRLTSLKSGVGAFQENFPCTT